MRHLSHLQRMKAKPHLPLPPSHPSQILQNASPVARGCGAVYRHAGGTNGRLDLFHVCSANLVRLRATCAVCSRQASIDNRCVGRTSTAQFGTLDSHHLTSSYQATREEVTSYFYQAPRPAEDSRAIPLGGMDHGTVMARVHAEFGAGGVCGRYEQTLSYSATRSTSLDDHTIGSPLRPRLRPPRRAATPRPLHHAAPAASA